MALFFILPGLMPAANAAKLKAHVVPHTHWDREWGFTEEQQMIRGIKLTDNLIDIMERDPRYKYFVWDGQSSVAEDYMAIRPEKMDRLRRLVEEGRIFLGPYYGQPDEFLASGESMIRNLLIGMRVADDAGGHMKVAYEADNFGHNGQLPQILNGFGIDSIIFYRGIHTGHRLDKTGFRWLAPDGSDVTAGNMVGGYGAFNWAVPVMELATMETAGIYSRLMNKNVSNHVLFPRGSDAAEPIAELPYVIDKLNRKFPQFDIRFSNFETYMSYMKKTAKKMDEHEGDIRGYNLLACISTNMPIKRENHAAFTKLEKYAEPFATLARMDAGRDYPAGFIDRAWKYILLSLPHDSVTGTSIQLANEDVMIRFRRARRISEQLSIRSMKTLCEGIRVDKENILLKPVTVFNPHTWPVTGPVEILFPFNKKDNDTYGEFKAAGMNDYIVVDEKGNDVPSFVSSDSPGDFAFSRFIASDVPGLGYRTYFFKAVKEKQRKNELDVKDVSIENEYLKLTFNRNGTFDMLDRETGVMYPSLHHFEDQYTPGDAWSYRHGSDGPLMTSIKSKAEIVVVENNDTIKTVRIRPAWNIPSQKNKNEEVPCGITTFVSLNPGVKRVDIYTEIDNRALNHRLRAAFPTGVAADTVAVDSQFGVMDRNVDVPNTVESPDNHVPTYYQMRFVDVAGESGSLAVFNRGLPEYEARREEGGTTLLLTLIRAIGNYTPETRESIPEPRLETEDFKYDTQVQGINRAYYAVYPHAGGWENAGVNRRAAEFDAPMWPESLFVLNAEKWMRGVSNTERYYKFPEGNLPAELSYMSVEPAQVMLSAFKKAEADDSIVVRVYNASGTKQKAGIDFYKKLNGVAVTDMRENEIEGAAAAIGLTLSETEIEGGLTGSNISFDIGPYKIVTLKLDVDFAELRNAWHNMMY